MRAPGSEKGITKRRRRQREKILRIAGRLFWQKSFLGTSIDDIAQAADINKATIYYYFESKSVILYELVMEAMQELYNQALPVANSTLPPEKKLESLMANHLKWGMSHPRQAGLGQAEQKSLPPRLMRSYDIKKDEYEVIFRETIIEIITKNGLYNADDKLTTLLTLGLANSIIPWYKSNGRLTAEEIASQTVTYIMRALLCRIEPAGSDALPQNIGALAEATE